MQYIGCASARVAVLAQGGLNVCTSASNSSATTWAYYLRAGKLTAHCGALGGNAATSNAATAAANAKKGLAWEIKPGCAWDNCIAYSAHASICRHHIICHRASLPLAQLYYL